MLQAANDSNNNDMIAHALIQYECGIPRPISMRKQPAPPPPAAVQSSSILVYENFCPQYRSSMRRALNGDR